MTSKQSGNVLLWIILGVVAIGLAVVIIWRYFAASDTLDSAQNSADSSLTAKATTKPLKVNEYTWSIATSRAVNLSDWGLMLTVPGADVGKVAYWADKTNNTYHFASTDVLTPDCDLKYYRQTLITTPGFGITRYDGDFEYYFDDESMTYATAYTKLKDPEGNFFMDPQNRKIYKVGGHYYHVFNAPTEAVSQAANPEKQAMSQADRLAARKQYCGENVRELETDQVFIDSISTLKQL